MTWQLVHPWFLALLLGIAWWLYSPRVRSALPYSDVRLFDLNVRPSWRLRMQWLPTLLRTLWLALLVVALARPRTADTSTAVYRDVIAIMFVVDVSGSMAAIESTGPEGPRTRLDHVKKLIDLYFSAGGAERGRPGTLAGLVAFSNAPRVVCPITTSHESLVALSDELAVDEWENRTNIGDALALAIDRLRQSSVPERVVILCSDGAHNVSEGMPPGEAASIAEALNVRIHTIAVGGQPAADASSDNASGIEALRRIAEITGGRFFAARQRSSADELVVALSAAEPTRIAVEGYVRWNEQFPDFITASLLLCLLDTALTATWLRITP